MQNITQIYALSKRNVILRYKNSLIGFLWGFIKPLLYLIIFQMVFSKSFGAMPNYVLFALSGLIMWFFFSNVTGQSIGSIAGSSGLLKAINIPPYFFPLSEILSEMFNLLLTLIVFLVMMKWFGLVYSLKLFLIVPCIILFAIFSLGLNLILSSVNVFFRDIGIIWATVQPALFFITPIAIPESMIADNYKFVVALNPIYYFIKLGRDVLYDASQPTDYSLWGLCCLIAAVTLVIGLLIFSRLKNQFISAI